MSHIPSTIVAMLLAAWFSTVSPAQQGAASSPSMNSSRVDRTRTAAIKIQGCVAGGKRYTFMQTGTEAMFTLIGKTERFATVRGKLIEISGDEFSPQPKSDELPRLRINHLRVIANRCPIQSRVPSRTEIPSSTYQTPPASPNTAPYADPGTTDQTPPNVNNPNISGDTGAPSPGTGNPPSPPPK